MKIQVQITDPAHPHAKEYGVLDDEQHPNSLSMSGMCLVELENCPHGNDGCYAYKNQCRRLADEEDDL